MELLQLRYFCDAAETQNFSKTAHKFLVPPSNISQSIKRLEKELGIRLFSRSANKIALNENGFKFYQNARTALDLLDNAKKEVQQNGIPESIRINIQINRHIVMETIESFQKKYADISFIITHSIDQGMNDYDFIVTDKELDFPYVKQAIKEENMLLAYHKDSFSLKERPTVEELRDCPFITMSSGNSIYDCTQRICNDLGFAPRIVLESEDPFYIRKCIELGLGVAIVPEISWRRHFGDGVTFKSIGDYKRPIYLYQKHLAGAHLERFRDALVSSFERY